MSNLIDLRFSDVREKEQSVNREEFFEKGGIMKSEMNGEKERGVDFWLRYCRVGK